MTGVRARLPRALILCLVAASLVGIGSCMSSDQPTRPIEEVLTEHAGSLMAIEGVVGIAEGRCDDEPCIHVLVVERTDRLRRDVPEVIEGYRVDLKATGEIRAL